MKYLTMLLTLLLLVACSNEAIDIEAKNEHSWQKYMNEDEFNKIQVGMTYTEIVKIAGGEGTEVNTNIYEWPDEILLTQAYELTFKDNKLTEKKIIEKRGNSTR